MEDFDRGITCSICLSNFRKPKIIDCHHTYCETCLDDYINKFAVDDNFDCALCRRTIAVPRNGAKDFPVNFYVEDQEIANKKEEFCVEHGNQILDGYCSDCQLVVCRKCKETDHQTHDCQSLQGIRQTFVLELKTLKQELADKIPQFQSYSDFFRTRISQKKKSTERLCTEVDKQVNRICQTTHKQGDEMKDILKKTLAEELMTLDAMLVEAKRNLFSIKSLHTMTSQILKEASTVEMINSMDIIRMEKEDVCPRDVKTSEVPILPVPEFHPGDFSTESLSRLIGLLNVAFQNNFNIHEIGEIWTNNPGYNLGKLSWSVGVVARSERLSISLDMVNKEIKSCNCQFTLKLINRDDDERSLIERGDKTFTSHYDMSYYEWESVIDMDEISDPDIGFIDDEGNFIIHADLHISHIVLLKDL
ncbi:tripartite motif-containing protein 2 [Patella vulgata]|uniref:tripartite motif-containing protein 2 n=1 Tax=Patella vulgata TaxID=6465 RepID=UPI00218078DA|nr:tripartite motif-containing protein 2 [Patella vulgata]